jgi:ribose 5-phosphate isomerase A
VVTRRVEAMGAKVAPRLRPDGSVFLTDNGNPYLQCQFPPAGLGDVRKLNLAFQTMPGVIETALFIHMAHEVLVAYTDGTTGYLKRSH